MYLGFINLPGFKIFAKKLKKEGTLWKAYFWIYSKFKDFWIVIIINLPYFKKPFFNVYNKIDDF